MFHDISEIQIVDTLLWLETTTTTDFPDGGDEFNRTLLSGNKEQLWLAEQKEAKGKQPGCKCIETNGTPRLLPIAKNATIPLFAGNPPYEFDALKAEIERLNVGVADSAANESVSSLHARQ